MYNFQEQRTKEKNTSREEVSVASKATQYNAKHDSSKATFLPLKEGIFRDYPLLENHKTSSSQTLDFSKNNSSKAETAIQRSYDLI